MFATPEDIANRALQHCGAARIVTLQDDSKNASEIAQCYDGLRRSELQRNVWTFAVKRTVLYPVNTPMSGHVIGGNNATQGYPTLLLVPEAWSALRTYKAGHIVAYNGQTWVNTITGNSGQQPGLDSSTGWDTYFGSMCAQPYDTTGGTGYWIGDLVYRMNGNSVFVFVSLENSNSNDPLAATVWSALNTYDIGDIVQDAAGYFWQSTIPSNTGYQPGVYGAWKSSPTYTVGALVIGSDNVLYSALVGSTNVNPANGAAPVTWQALGFPGSWPMWNSTTTYAKNAMVCGDDGYLYLSLQNTNLGQQPVGSVYNPNAPAANWWQKTRFQAPWIPNFSAATSNAAWLGLDATTDKLNITYPLGTGPSIQTETKNVFMLPNGYLRKAPQEPSAGANSWLGAPTGLAATDWEFDGRYIVSRSASPIVFRFVADVTQVPKMHDMFCEGLAARIGLEVCETLTQSGAKLGAIGAEYKMAMGDARTINAIEQGPTEPEIDEYLAVRI